MYWIVGGSNLLDDENTDEPRNFHPLFNDLTRLQAAESFTEAQQSFSLQIIQTSSGSTKYRGSFQEIKWPGHDVDISHLVPKAGISGATPLLPLHAFMTWTRTSTFSRNRKAHYRDIINPPATGLCSGPESYILSPYPFNVLFYYNPSTYTNASHMGPQLHVSKILHTSQLPCVLHTSERHSILTLSPVQQSSC